MTSGDLRPQSARSARKPHPGSFAPLRPSQGFVRLRSPCLTRVYSCCLKPSHGDAPRPPQAPARRPGAGSLVLAGPSTPRPGSRRKPGCHPASPAHSRQHRHHLRNVPAPRAPQPRVWTPPALVASEPGRAPPRLPTGPGCLPAHVHYEDPQATYPLSRPPQNHHPRPPRTPARDAIRRSRGTVRTPGPEPSLPPGSLLFGAQGSGSHGGIRLTYGGIRLTHGGRAPACAATLPGTPNPQILPARDLGRGFPCCPLCLATPTRLSPPLRLRTQPHHASSGEPPLTSPHLA